MTETKSHTSDVIPVPLTGLSRDHVAALEGIAGVLNAALTTDQVAVAILGPCARATGAAAVSLALVDAGGERMTVLGTTGRASDVVSEWRRSAIDFQTPMGEAAATGRAVLIESAEAWVDRYPAHEVGPGQPAAGPQAAIPLRAGEAVIGVLALTFPGDGRDFSDGEVAFLGQVARHCAVALDRAELTDEERRSADRLGHALERTSWLQMIAAALASAVDEAQVFDALRSYGTATLGAAGLAILEPPGRATFKEHWPSATVPGHPLPGLGADSFAAAALRDGAPAIASPIPDADGLPEAFRDGGIAVIPFHVGATASGALVALYDRPVGFSAERRGQLTAVAELLGQALERSRLYGSVEAAEERLRAIVETVADGLLLLDEDGSILSANPAVERIFGYTSNELVGRPMSLLVPALGPWDEPGGPGAGAGAGADGDGDWSPVAMEGRRSDGGTVPLELALSETLLPGRLLTTALVHDMTRRKEIEEALRTARRAAEDADGARKRVLARLSSDVRTPLASILGLCDLLLSDVHGPLAAGHTDPVRRIRRSGLHLLEIVEEMLFFTDLDSEPAQVRREPTDLGAAVDEVVGLLRARAEPYGVELRWSPGPEAVMVETDPVRLRSLLVHLLGSLVRGDPDHPVAVELQRQAGEPVLTVTGPAADLYPATRLDADDAQLTHALATPISGRLAHHVGARADLDSDGDTGRFTLRFPHAGD